MKAIVNSDGGAPARSSLHGAQLEAKENEASLGTISNQTLPFAFGARSNNATSLWNLSSPNIASTERLVTLDHIEESESEMIQPDSLANSSLIAKLREQAATADKALRLKALQVEEYERELELVHEKLAQVERKNEQLRAGFEQKLTQLEQNIHLRKPDSRANTSVEGLRAVRGSLGALRQDAARLIAEVCSRAAQGKSESLRIKEYIDNYRTLQRLLNEELKKAQEELAAASQSAHESAQLQKTVDDLRIQQQRLMNGRSRLLRDIKAAAEAQAEMLLGKARMEAMVGEVNMRANQLEEKLEDLTAQKKKIGVELQKCREQLKASQERLVGQTLRVGRAQTRNSVLRRKLRKTQHKLHILKKTPAAAPTTPMHKKGHARRRSSHLTIPAHSCLSGRSLCPRRARIEALKRAYGL